MSNRDSWTHRNSVAHVTCRQLGISETTVVLKCLPETLNARIVLSVLDTRFFGCYDFFYLPVDPGGLKNLGVAYINFRYHEKAWECLSLFLHPGLGAWPAGRWGARAEWFSIQGLQANIRMLKPIDWANLNIPEDAKPMVFDEHGSCLPTMDIFPPLQRTPGWRDWDEVHAGWQRGEVHGESVQGAWGDQWRQSANAQGHWDEMPSSSHEAPMHSDEASQGFESDPKTSDGSNSMQLPISDVATAKFLPVVTKYACPSCSSCFAKWSACYQHVMNDPKCSAEICGEAVSETELQTRCKEKAYDLSTDEANETSPTRDVFPEVNNNFDELKMSLQNV
eukprot:Skav205530  [mRNA]  locus=scaffold4253:221872:222879:+ [translate_table: standard]